MLQKKKKSILVKLFLFISITLRTICQTQINCLRKLTEKSVFPKLKYFNFSLASTCQNHTSQNISIKASAKLQVSPLAVIWKMAPVQAPTHYVGRGDYFMTAQAIKKSRKKSFLKVPESTVLILPLAFIKKGKYPCSYGDRNVSTNILWRG